MKHPRCPAAGRGGNKDDGGRACYVKFSAPPLGALVNSLWPPWRPRSLPLPVRAAEFIPQSTLCLLALPRRIRALVSRKEEKKGERKKELTHPHLSLVGIHSRFPLPSARALRVINYYADCLTIARCFP